MLAHAWMVILHGGIPIWQQGSAQNSDCEPIRDLHGVV